MGRTHVVRYLSRELKTRSQPRSQPISEPHALAVLSHHLFRFRITQRYPCSVEGDVLKVVLLEVPFDLRSVNREQLRLAVRDAALNSSSALAIILPNREPNPQGVAIRFLPELSRDLVAGSSHRTNNSVELRRTMIFHRFCSSSCAVATPAPPGLSRGRSPIRLNAS